MSTSAELVEYLLDRLDCRHLDNLLAGELPLPPAELVDLILSYFPTFRLEI